MPKIAKRLSDKKVENAPLKKKDYMRRNAVK